MDILGYVAGLLFVETWDDSFVFMRSGFVSFSVNYNEEVWSLFNFYWPYIELLDFKRMLHKL